MERKSERSKSISVEIATTTLERVLVLANIIRSLSSLFMVWLSKEYSSVPRVERDDKKCLSLASY